MSFEVFWESSNSVLIFKGSKIWSISVSKDNPDRIDLLSKSIKELEDAFSFSKSRGNREFVSFRKKSAFSMSEILSSSALLDEHKPYLSHNEKLVLLLKL